ncbi:MAG: hypothetical protein AB7F19_07570 [Candidatus Babeliales bacterium]
MSDMSTDDDFDVEDEGVYNFRDMYDLVVQHKDVIFTIPSVDVDKLRSGLTVRKSKDNMKLKNAGLQPEASTLSFKIYPALDKDKKAIPGTSEVRVKLQPRKGIMVLNVAIPDNEL